MILHSKQKTPPRSFIEVLQSLKPAQCSCVLAGCMILMFSKFLNSQCFYHTRRCPKNWPPLYTFKSSTVGSQTMQPFSCCIIEQITLETPKKRINNFVFCLFLSSKDGIRRKSKTSAPNYKGKLISISCQQINYRTIEVHQVSSQEMPMIPFGNRKALVNYANMSYFTQNVFKFRRFVWSANQITQASSYICFSTMFN